MLLIIITPDAEQMPGSMMRKDLEEINVAAINMDHSKPRRPRNANRGLYR